MISRRRLLQAGGAFAALTPAAAVAEDCLADLTIEEANRHRVGIMTGSATGTYIKVGGDLATVLDCKEDLRIVPMVGRGSLQNVDDLLKLYQVDMALVQSDVLEFIRITDPGGIERQRLAYIAKIYNEQIHVVARDGAGIRSIDDLNNKRVNVGREGSGSRLTADVVFKVLNISGVEPYTYSNTDALERLKSGALDAMFFVQRQPANFLQSLPSDAGLKIVPVQHVTGLQDIYKRDAFDQATYPGLTETRQVDTISVGAVLAVYDAFNEGGFRRDNLERFTRQLVENFSAFREPPRDARWGRTDLSESVPGWKRFGPMQEMIDFGSIQAPAECDATDAMAGKC